MKIVIDGRAIKQTGVGRYIEETTARVLDLDSVNEYCMAVRGQDMPSLKGRFHKAALKQADYIWYTFAEQVGFLRLLLSFHANLVHFPNFNFPILYPGKFVMTLHDLTLFRFKNINKSKLHPAIYEIRNVVMKLVMRWGAKRAQMIMVPTEFVKNDIIETLKVPADKVVVVGESGEFGRKSGKFNFKSHGVTRPYFLYVGNAYPHKNLERLVEAFAKIVDEHKLDIQLVIAGKKDVFHERVEAEVVRDKLGDRVVFTDYVTDAELAGLYEKAELYIFPSLSEGFGLPGLEAMAYGLPVVSSNATCLPEVYGNAAEYFDPLSVDDMASVIAKLYNDKKRQAELIKNGKEQIKKFSWEETARKTLAVYKKVLGQG